MISLSKVKTILNALAGVSSTNLSSLCPSVVYLGLCSNKPSDEGEITGEPFATDNGYERKKISGTGAEKLEKYFSETSTCKISNNKEIQFKTARKDFPAKINYWFLSTSSTGTAYAWGLIKKTIVDNRSVEGAEATIVLEDTVNLELGQTYIISFNDKEYELQAFEKVIQSGNDSTGIAFEAEDGLFSIVFEADLQTVHITTSSDKPSNNIGIYEKGIEVKKATVVTFYENDLEISLNEEYFEK